MALPVVKVEIAFDSGYTTPAASRTWTDVSAYLDGDAGGTILRGRADERSQVDPSTYSVTLDNADGRFTPERASSPYYPNVKIGRPIRETVTYGATVSVRFTGYIQEWPVAWPTGSDATARVTIQAVSRRAFMGLNAPLGSAIRTAYLATSPEAYWPMDEEFGVQDSSGRQVFRDITNTSSATRDKQAIGAFNSSTSLADAIIINDGTPGPVDEASLVKLPAFTSINQLGKFSHYIGASTAIKLDPAAGLTIEVVARIQPTVDLDTTSMSVNILRLMNSTQSSVVLVSAFNAGVGSPLTGLNCEMDYRDPDTFAVLDSEFGNGSQPDLLYTMTDGEIHHYAFTLDTTGKIGKFYFDGALIETLTLLVPLAYTERFSQIIVGDDTYLSNLWVGHLAAHSRALTAAEILDHAEAATSATETILERVERLAGQLGIPAVEADAETSIAMPVGPQKQAGRGATEVLDELAASTGGILYDKRDGNLFLEARNHRYNTASAFTLSTTGQEIEVDLAPVTDTRYLVNTVAVELTGTTALSSEEADATTTITQEDATSISTYGISGGSYQMVSTSQAEAEAFAADVLSKYATPRLRVSRVTVDLVDLTSAQRALVLAADISTLFTLSGLPGQMPSSTMLLFVEGYEENISAGGHTITFNTTPGATNPAWVLGDATKSNLGTTTYLVY